MAASPSVPLGNKPGVTNWVERFNALPKGSWIRRAAEHIKAKGKPDSLAIPFAVKAAERICSTGDTNLPGLQQVSPKSKGEACAALLVWKKAAAQAKASNLTTAQEVRRIDLAGAFIAYDEGWSEHLPTGASEAYLDLAEQAEPIDLAFNPDQPRGEHGRWVKALYNRELKRVLRGMKPNNFGTRKDNPSFSRSQLNAAKGIARKRTLKRVDEIAKRAVPTRVNSRAMTLSVLRDLALIDLSESR